MRRLRRLGEAGLQQRRADDYAVWANFELPDDGAEPGRCFARYRTLDSVSHAPEEENNNLKIADCRSN
jgi:hypothetical protein